MPTGHDNLVDINSAPRDWLVSVGIDETLADKIIDSRPYQSTKDLLEKGILPPATYEMVKDRIIARRA
jgi:DNA uptake protein ComE-like DNA-binding protein